MRYYFYAPRENWRLDLSVNELPSDFTPPSLSIKTKIIERYGRDGGDFTGDGRISSRKIKISVNIRGRTETEYRANVDSLLKFCVLPKNSDLFFCNETTGYRLRIKITGATPKTKAAHSAEEWNFDCIAADGAWESIDEFTNDEYGEQVNHKDVLFFQNSEILDAWPTFELEAQSTNTEFALISENTGAVFRLGESQFVAGAKVTLSSVTGSVLLIAPGEDAVDVRQKMADNTGFLFFAPGENRIRYESLYGSVNLTCRYRLRRLTD